MTVFPELMKVPAVIRYIKKQLKEQEREQKQKDKTNRNKRTGDNPSSDCSDGQ